MVDLIGQSLGRYRILEQLGEGGMAIVYKAYDTRLESEVAVKVIRTEQLAPSILERTLRRFEREAKALAKLTHSNIVKVLDYGEQDGKPYLVMPYLPGGTLKQLINGKAMPYQEAARLLVPIARALAYAHQQGMIHRDVKPSNILITQSGDPMLTDFGIAKIIDDDTTMDLTGTSAAVGTPEYMAPEQVTSKTVDQRADIYALGIIFYEMVTGRKPYQADTPMAVLFKHASEPLPRPKSFVSNLPDSVEQTLLKALAKRPEDRYQEMGEFASTLMRLSGQEVTTSLPSAHERRARNRATKESTSIPHLISFKRWGWIGLVGMLTLVAITALALVAITAALWIFGQAANNTGADSSTNVTRFASVLSKTPVSILTTVSTRVMQAAATSYPSITPTLAAATISEPPAVHQTPSAPGYCVLQVKDNPTFGIAYCLGKFNIPYDPVEVYYRCELDSQRKSCLQQIRLPLDSHGARIVNFGDYLVMLSVSQGACNQPDSLWVANSTGQ